jgi:hypothetical protein
MIGKQHFALFSSTIKRPPNGSGNYLPGGRPPVNVSRKGGRSPKQSTALEALEVRLSSLAHKRQKSGELSLLAVTKELVRQASRAHSVLCAGLKLMLRTRAKEALECNLAST